MAASPIADDEEVRVPKRTKPTEELADVYREAARAAIQRLVDGYKDKSSASCPAATTNLAGCILAQKATDRQNNGYVQIAPIVEILSKAEKGEKEQSMPQGAHRLVVLAYKSDQEVAKLLAGAHASHLCHQPTCVNPDHIVVESKNRNEARSSCKNAGAIIRCTIGGRPYMAPPRACACEGEKCIFMIEHREAYLQA